MTTSTLPDDSVIDPTRDRLLETAEEMFADFGFEGTSVRKICDRAGANIAAVNYHFGNKKNLYAEAIKFAHANCVRGVDLPPWPSEAPMEEQLRDFIRAVVARMVEVPRASSIRLMTREMTEPTPEGADAVREYIQPMAERLYAMVTALAPAASHHERMMIGFSIIGQCLYYRQNRAVSQALFGADYSVLDPDTIAGHIANFTLAALGRDEPVGQHD